MPRLSSACYIRSIRDLARKDDDSKTENRGRVRNCRDGDYIADGAARD